MSDRLIRGLGCGSAVRFLCCEATAAVAEAAACHQLSPAATALIGEAMVGALLMSATIKGEERITVQLQVERPPMSVICDVTAEGGIRARISPTTLPAGTARITGMMLVIKHSARKEMYRGVTEISDETITAALARHLERSSQVGARLLTAVHLDDSGQITQAAGLLIERMPPSPGLPSLDEATFTTQLDAADADAALAEVAGGHLLGEPLLVAEERPVRWQCRCSQERVESMLMGLGVDELEEMLAKDGGAEVTCHFCSTCYTIAAPRLSEMIVAEKAQGEA